MVASFIIFVRGVEEVGKEADWLNVHSGWSQRLFISSRRDGGGEHRVRTLLSRYRLSASPPPPRQLFHTSSAPCFYAIIINFLLNSNCFMFVNLLENKQMSVESMIVLVSQGWVQQAFEKRFWFVAVCGYGLPLNVACLLLSVCYLLRWL